MFKKSLALLFSLIFVIGLIGAGVSSAEKKFSPPDGLTVVIKAEPTNADPQVPDDGNSRTVVWDNVYEFLTQLDLETSEPKPYLAKDWEQLNPTTWRFHLREGVRFHNGEKFDADAAVFSIERMTDPETKSELLSYVNTIEEAKKVDEDTIEIVTKVRDPILPMRLTWLPMVPPEFTEENPDALTTEMIGTGPYELVNWNRGTEIVFEANEDWWKGDPRWKNVKFIFREEASVRLSVLMAKEAQLVRAVEPALAKQAPKVASSKGTETILALLNPQGGLTQDWRIRKAIALAINPEGLQEIFSGYAHEANAQIFASQSLGFDPGISSLEQDLEEAKRLVKEAGAVGKTIRFSGTSGRWLKIREINSAVTEMIRQTGLKVKSEVLDFKSWLDTLFYSNVEKVPEITLFVHGNELFHPDRSYDSYVHSEGPGSRINSPVMDYLIEKAKSAKKARAEEIYSTISRKLKEEALILGLVREDFVSAMLKNIDYKPRQDGRFLLDEISTSG